MSGDIGRGGRDRRRAMERRESARKNESATHTAWLGWAGVAAKSSAFFFFGT